MYDRNKYYSLIKCIKNKFNMIRKDIQKVDNSLALIHIFDCLSTILSVMLSIYVFVMVNHLNDPYVKESMFIYLYSSLYCTSKIVITCLVHGMVYERIEQLMQSFQELDVSCEAMSENCFREIIQFAHNTTNLRIGFTIAGFAPFNKSTLLAV